MDTITATGVIRPVALGRLRLRLHRPEPRYLRIDVVCPLCTRIHTHGWALDRDDPWTAHSPRTVHCEGHLRPAGHVEYYIAADPKHEKHHRRLLNRIRRALEREGEPVPAGLMRA